MLTKTNQIFIGKIDLSENLFSEISEDFIKLSEEKIDKFINFVSNKK